MRKILIAFVLVAGLGCGSKPPQVAKAGFTPSKETTFVTEPVDENGYVDYETALNERLRGKITPATNANVLLWQAVGPKPVQQAIHPDYFKWLQADRPPAEGAYYVDSNVFFRSRGVDILKEEEREKYWYPAKHPWTAKEEPIWAAWLEANKQPLELVTQASQRPDYYYPLVSRDPNDGRGLLIHSLLPSMQSIRAIADALTRRAMLRTGEGQFDDAWKDLMTLHRLSRLLIRGGTLIEMLIGFAIDGATIRADVAFLSHSKPTAEQARRYAADLEKLPPLASLADKIDVCERLTFLDIVQSTHRYGFEALQSVSGSKPPEEPDAAAKLLVSQLDWDTVFRTGNQTFDRVVKILKQPDRPSRVRDWTAFEAEFREQRKQLGDNSGIRKLIRDGNPFDQAVSEKVGKILVTTLFPAVNKVHSSPDRLIQNHRNLRLALALAAYRADEGRYPAKLADLMPKYVTEVPDDLFSGKPLIYKPADGGYLLYSVGENGEDDDGATFGEDPAGDDLRVRMPPKP